MPAADAGRSKWLSIPRAEQEAGRRSLKDSAFGWMAGRVLRRGFERGEAALVVFLIGWVD